MSEYILESFYNYLMNIGMIDIDSVNQLNEIFQDIINQDSNIDFQSAMSSSLIFFLNNMTEYQKKYVPKMFFITFHILSTAYQQDIHRPLWKTSGSRVTGHLLSPP